MAVTSISEINGARGRRLPPALALAWLALVLLVLAAVLFIALFGKASDGAPQVQIALEPAPLAAPAKSADLHHAPPPSAPAAPSAEEPGKATPTSPAPEAQSAPAPSTAAPAGAETLPPRRVPDTVSAPVYAGKALVADPALIEQTSQGPLPRIADDGRKPMTAYAPAVPAALLRGKKKIAVVVTGLGISARATKAALDGLPSGVTLAFAPYAHDVQRWVSEARKLGHEVLLEVPMEPYDFPDSDPGPHTLRPTLDEDGNTARLKWSLSRFTGYAGVTNLLGGRFLASADATGPVMTDLKDRGLFFYDSGTTARSAAESVATDVKAPYVQSAIEIDSIQSGMEIDQRLKELEARARQSGAAAGTGFLYPVTIARIAAWAQGLDGRGFVLVPASSIVGADRK